MSRRLMSPRFSLSLALGLSLCIPAQNAAAQSFSDYYSDHPTAWFDALDDDQAYFDTQRTPAWQVNETCNDSDAFSVSSYNIWHNVPFTADFGDEMEGSLGEVVKCADVVLFQEAWDYDDIILDGPKADMAARGYSLMLPPNAYCEDNFDTEKDCTGLVMFVRSGTSLVKSFGVEYFDILTSYDVGKGKGVWGAIFSKEGKHYYVFNTHLNYGNHGHLESSVPDGNITSDQARIWNMVEVRDYVRRMVQENRASFPPAAVLLGGDVNSDFANDRSDSAGRILLSQAGASGTFSDPFEYRASGTQLGRLEVDNFKSNWPRRSWEALDSGPNINASGNRGDYDTLLVGRAEELGVCPTSVLAYSGWAPAWRTHGGERRWPSNTHSDHYGRYIKVHASCGKRGTLVLQNESTQRISYWTLSGTMTREWTSEVPPSLDTGWRVAGMGDFNGDLQNDLILQNMWTRRVAIWMMSGTDVTSGPVLDTLPDEGWSVEGAGDFNLDGRTDIVLQNAWTGRIGVWLMDGLGVWAGLEVNDTLQPGWAVAGVGDLDMDGDADLALQHASTREICGWQLAGMSIEHWFCLSQIPDADWRVTGVGDLTDDGRNDIVLQNQWSGDIGVWPLAWGTDGNPYRYTGMNVTPSPGTSWKVVGAF
jgi:hypothetical protein